MEELVGELERLAERLWSADELKSATGVGATELCQLLGRLGEAVGRVRSDAEIGYRAALEAYWADKAGNFAKAAPQGEDAVRTVDENMAISSAAVGIRTKHGEVLRLLDAFAMEFVGLALDVYKPHFGDGEIFFECGNLFAAQERTESLKRLARAIDELEKGECGLDVHAAIIAYTA